MEKRKGWRTVEQKDQILRLETSQIRPNPHQPRQIFEEKGLQELSASIRRHGVLQPLTVRRQPDGWELVAGERRLRAARMAGVERVPCVEVSVNDRESAVLALVENLQRRDLHYFEEAEAIAAYLRETGSTQEEAAAQLGRSAPAVANKLRLLRLSPACKEKLMAAELTERHARTLLRLETEEDRLEALEHIVRHGLNVARTEQYIEKRLEEIQTVEPHRRRTFILKDVRLFLNSVERGLKLVREAGIAAVSGREDTEEEILLTIRIPKQKR